MTSIDNSGRGLCGWLR